MYRNNPRFANFTDETASPYQKGIHKVGVELKRRLFDLETNRRAKARAEELARKQKEAQDRMIKIAQDQERQRTFDELLPTIFDKWTESLLRQSLEFITREEIVRVLLT